MSESTIAKLQQAVDAARHRRSPPPGQAAGNALLAKKNDRAAAAAELLQKTRALELELHGPATRADRKRLEELLHRDFFEIGRSGRIYSRAQLIESLPTEARSAAIRAQDFDARVLSARVVLLTYKSSEVTPDGSAGGYALRSSVWTLGEPGWQIFFHQGTPAAAFELRTNLIR